MTDESNDKKLYRLIEEAVVPPGLRPKSPTDVEKMLRACTGERLSDEKLRRMLRKVKGEIPLGKREATQHELDALPLTEAQRELVALHRAQGKDLPPEVLKMLEEFRAQAQEKNRPDNEA